MAILVVIPRKFIKMAVIEFFLAVDTIIDAREGAVWHQQRQWETEHLFIIGFIEQAPACAHRQLFKRQKTLQGVEMVMNRAFKPQPFFKQTVFELITQPVRLVYRKLQQRIIFQNQAHHTHCAADFDLMVM
ncbi:hypothetical protein D3C75_734310 [compost metagenome]